MDWFLYDNGRRHERVKKTVENVGDKQVSVKKICTRKSVFIFKKANKKIMESFKLRNQFPNSKNDGDRKPYNNQQVNLMRQAKKTFLSDLNIHVVTDLKTFGKKLELSLSEKVVTQAKTT